MQWLVRRRLATEDVGGMEAGRLSQGGKVQRGRAAAQAGRFAPLGECGTPGRSGTARKHAVGLRAKTPTAAKVWGISIARYGSESAARCTRGLCFGCRVLPDQDFVELLAPDDGVLTFGDVRHIPTISRQHGTRCPWAGELRRREDLVRFSKLSFPAEGNLVFP